MLHQVNKAKEIFDMYVYILMPYYAKVILTFFWIF